MLRPLRDHILVLPDALNAHTPTTGIILQQRKGMESSQEQLGRTGTVLAIGDGRKWRTKHHNGKAFYFASKQTMQVRPGDRVLFGEFEWTKHKDATHGDCIILQESDIAGIIEQ